MSMIPADDLRGKLLTAKDTAGPVLVAWSRFAPGTAMVLPFARPAATALVRNSHDRLVTQSGKIPDSRPR